MWTSFLGICLTEVSSLFMAKSGHPKSGVDYPTTYQDLLAWFPDNEACLDYLANLRWPDGFVCPACGATDFWRTAEDLWMCQGCARRTSVTAGTIFHRTRTPLSTWFAAIWFVTSQKNGISAQGLQRVLGFKSYETAWAWMHKLRRAMVRPDRDRLSGIVEVDETFVGGVSPGKQGASSDKVPVMIAVEKTGTGRKLGRIRLEVTDRPGTLELVKFAERMVLPGSTIRTDGAQMLRKLGDKGYTHEYTPATTHRTRPTSCPASTSPHHCSNDGSQEPCTSPSPSTSCPTTSTSSPPGSTAATPTAAACSSTDSSSKPPAPNRSRCTACSDRSPIGTSVKQMPRTSFHWLGATDEISNHARSDSPEPPPNVLTVKKRHFAGR